MVPPDRLVPSGWFELADGPKVRALAANVPHPRLFSVTLMRIPSLLELPFGLLAYLTVVSWLDPRRYRRLATPGVLALACAAYTITFGLIELALNTPYTMQNLVVRGVSAVLCAFGLSWLGRYPCAHPGAGAPRTPAQLLAFTVSTAAMGYLVMAIYDTAMLYSLGRVGEHLPLAGLAGGVLVVSRWAAGRLRRMAERPVGPGLDLLTTTLTWWLALFLIPALAIRYELGFGSRAVGAAAGFGLAVPAVYPETRLLCAAVLATVAAVGACAASDRRIAMASLASWSADQ